MCSSVSCPSCHVCRNKMVPLSGLNPPASKRSRYLSLPPSQTWSRHYGTRSCNGSNQECWSHHVSCVHMWQKSNNVLHISIVLPTKWCSSLSFPSSFFSLFFLPPLLPPLYSSPSACFVILMITDCRHAVEGWFHLLCRLLSAERYAGWPC